MCMALFPVAACHLTVRVGWPANPASFCRCACCRVCFVGAFLRRWIRRIAWDSYSSLVITLRSKTLPLSPIGSLHCEWVVYAKRPFAGPAAVLAYLSRYTHRVAISNSRLIRMDVHGVTFKWKDYRARGKTRHKTMMLGADEFMRRFLLHVLPGGFHRIRHYGLIANGGRKAYLARARELLHVEPVATVVLNGTDATGESAQPTFVCRECGAAMLIIEILTREQWIRAPPHTGGAA